jgi:hypothetical protein
VSERADSIYFSAFAPSTWITEFPVWRIYFGLATAWLIETVASLSATIPQSNRTSENVARPRPDTRI